MSLTTVADRLVDAARALAEQSLGAGKADVLDQRMMPRFQAWVSLQTQDVEYTLGLQCPLTGGPCGLYEMLYLHQTLAMSCQVVEQRFVPILGGADYAVAESSSAVSPFDVR